MPVFKDADTVPVWAKDAVHSLCAIGVFDATDDMIDGGKELDKESAVEYLYRALMA